jgi:hypothetical protein
VNRKFFTIFLMQNMLVVLVMQMDLNYVECSFDSINLMFQKKQIMLQNSADKAANIETC